MEEVIKFKWADGCPDYVTAVELDVKNMLYCSGLGYESHNHVTIYPITILIYNSV